MMLAISEPAPATSISISADDHLLPAAAVRQRYSISKMTLYRWQRDPRVALPQPRLAVGQYRYWRLGDLLAWERARERAQAQSCVIARK